MIYFLYGDGAPLQIKLQEIIEKCKNANTGSIEKIYDTSNEELESFFNSISSYSMFSSHEIIILKKLEESKYIDEIINGIKIYNLSNKDVILVYEEFINEFGKCTNEINKKYLDEIGNYAKVICYRKENEKNASKLMVQQELNISEGEAKELLDLIGEDYYKILNEIGKIKNFLDGEKYSLEKIYPIISISVEANLRELISNFFITHKYDKLLSYLQQEKSYMNFLYIVADELTNLLKIQLVFPTHIKNRNISYNLFKDKVYESIKNYFLSEKGAIHPYVLFLKLKNIDLIEIDNIKRNLSKILEIEYNIKSGNNEQDIAVESFIIDFFN